MDLIILTIISLITIFIITKFIDFPMPFLIIPIVLSITYNLLIKDIHFEFNVKMLAQLITGTYIGSTISKSELKNLKETFVPILFSLLFMVVGMITSATILVTIFKIDLATALLSTVPGGISDIVLMSYDFNADISIVALFQTIRMVSIIVVFPRFIKRFLANKQEIKSDKAIYKIEKVKLNYAYFITTLIIGGSFGYIGAKLGIVAGALVISTISTLIYSITTNKAHMPIFSRRFAQVLSGILIGSTIDHQIIFNLSKFILPTLIVLVLYFIYNIIISFIINKFTKMDLATAMFGCAPGGAGDMVLISTEMNLDVNHPQIILMHVSRLIVVLSLFPFIISLLLKLFG